MTRGEGELNRFQTMIEEVLGSIVAVVRTPGGGARSKLTHDHSFKQRVVEVRVSPGEGTVISDE